MRFREAPNNESRGRMWSQKRSLVKFRGISGCIKLDEGHYKKGFVADFLSYQQGNFCWKIGEVWAQAG